MGPERDDQGRLLSPSTVAGEAIFRSPRQIHLFPVVSPDLSPSGGRFCGGRAGDPSLTGVYMVGLGGLPAGGAMEELRSPEWFWLQVCGSFDGGAPWSTAVVRLLLPHSRISGFVLCVISRPDSVRWRIWSLKIMKTTMGCCAAELKIHGVTPSGAVSGDFPVARELVSSILGVCTNSGSGASLSRHGCRRGRSPEGAMCNFFRFLGFSVRSQYQ
jgi:hypothetical protein